MARWADVKKVADYIGMSEAAIRQHINRKTNIGKVFRKVGERTLRADLDELDAIMKGQS